MYSLLFGLLSLVSTLTNAQSLPEVISITPDTQSPLIASYLRDLEEQGYGEARMLRKEAFEKGITTGAIPHSYSDLRRTKDHINPNFERYIEDPNYILPKINLTELGESVLGLSKISKDFNEYVINAMKEWSVPGMALGIIKDNQIILTKGYGVRSLNYPDCVDEETVFPIASITKSFTAALISMLVEEGKLDWDDVIAKHIPNFQLYDANFTNQVTIRDALSHRTGLERAEHLWYLTSYNQQEVINHIKFLKPKWSIRSRFSYSNILYSVMGILQETVTGIPWDILISEKIFKPL
jgi:hypothetical protein